MTRPTSRWLLWLAVAGTSIAHAQPAVRDHRDDRKPAPPTDHDRDHGRDHRGPGATADDGPHEAPPPPRPETVTPRPGYVWVAGQWDWKSGAYAWTAGHWERERAGKQWRTGRWEQNGDRWKYTDGGWDAAGTATAPTPVPDGHDMHAGDHRGNDDHRGPGDQHGDDHRGDRPHRAWKLDQPVVSSYWPVKGKAGTRVVIRGKNFPASAQVMFGGQLVTGAKVTADQIVVVIPPTATSGSIELQAGRSRAVPVGSFEVAASFDAAAEQKRLDDERRAKAEADWAARQKALAKDRNARLAAMQQHQQELSSTRESRRAARVAELQSQFDRAFLADEETQAELTLHAQRVAELARMRDVASVTADGKIAIRIEMAQTREEDRHTQRLAALKTAFASGGSR